jgi:hypothetical protein
MPGRCLVRFSISWWDEILLCCNKLKCKFNFSSQHTHILQQPQTFLLFADWKRVKGPWMHAWVASSSRGKRMLLLLGAYTGQNKQTFFGGDREGRTKRKQRKAHGRRRALTTVWSTRSCTFSVLCCFFVPRPRPVLNVLVRVPFHTCIPYCPHACVRVCRPAYPLLD